MAIAVIHRSITQRRIFRNLLRQANCHDIQYFEAAADCMEEMTREKVRCLIVQKKILQEEGSYRGQKTDFSSFVASMPVLVVSYQFTQEETIELMRGGADGLLLMPFTPEVLYEKLAPLTNVAL